jgi:DNA-binding Lrp family transcriptional regulator
VTDLPFGKLFRGGTGRRKQRGDAEHPTDPVRSYSWDENDRRASPGRPIGDGSSGFFWAFKDALLQAARHEFARQRDEGVGDDPKVQRSYVDVLAAALKFLDKKTGDFFVSYEKIAETAHCSRSTAIKAIRALEDLGIIAHVRRSRDKEATEGVPGPQKEQAPNGYYFDCERRMAVTLWEFFKKTLNANLGRVASAAKRRADYIRAIFNEKAQPAPRPSDAYRGPEYLHGIKDPILRATLRRIADRMVERERVSGPSASP